MDTRYEVREGTQELSLEVRRGAVLRLTAEEGGALVPWDFDWVPELRQIDGPGRIVLRYGDAPGLTVTVDRTGRYRLGIPVIPGYRPVDPVEIRLEVGKRIEHRIELVPVR
jgi:hypothetical protein